MRNYLLILIGVFFACCSSDNVILAEPTSDSKIVKDTKETSTTMTQWALAARNGKVIPSHILKKMQEDKKDSQK